MVRHHLLPGIFRALMSVVFTFTVPVKVLKHNLFHVETYVSLPWAYKIGCGLEIFHKFC